MNKGVGNAGEDEHKDRRWRWLNLRATSKNAEVVEK
jgi:hypothetical protein